MTTPSIDILLAKLAAHLKSLRAYASTPGARYFDPRVVLPIFNAVDELLAHLRELRIDLFGDVPKRPLPAIIGSSDFEGRGHVRRDQVDELLRDLDYVFEVRAGSQLSLIAHREPPQRVFISHGGSPDWREVQSYVEKDAGLQTLELAQQPNRGRSVLQKLLEEAEQCSFAVIVMTGDDEVATDLPRARENVIHEIGFFQAKYGLSRVSLLYEEGTSIPSNIHGLVYIPFPKGLVSAAFATLHRELKDAFTH